MNTIIYRIDKNDIIVEVNDAWITFARENQAVDVCHPNNVISRPIWDFITDSDIIQLYKIIFDNIRTKWKVVDIPFRCDSPTMRRFLELEIAPLSEGMLQFRSVLIRAEQRNDVKLLQNNIERSDELLPICSICKKVDALGNKWLEVEDAIVSMNLFEKSNCPQLTNTLCPECDVFFKDRVNNI